jgi:hypothetical protein
MSASHVDPLRLEDVKTTADEGSNLGETMNATYELARTSRLKQSG